ncbi:MAG TPA: LON peptidase substrate-binding domain-containing protein [Rhodothermales bacterium]|nr:LON peptidase substrate-binding domain-containing protein [Rhodothermales bacterium]
MPSIENLPLFLLGVVLYPTERLPLHIFEPRYKEMVDYCLNEDRPFGVVYFNDGKLAQVGCTARISRVVKRYEDGKLDILVTGETRFRLINVHDTFSYLTADADPIVEPRMKLNTNMKERVITQHMRLLELAGRALRPSVYERVRNVSFVLAHNAGLTSDQKQELLELVTENERIAFLIRHFKNLLPRVEEIEEVRRKIQSNGHIRDFPPASPKEEGSSE